MSEALTKKEIDRYIELGDKIKERIVEVSCILSGIDTSFIRSKVDFNLLSVDSVYAVNDFLENSSLDSELNLCLDYDDGYDIVSFNKNLLYMKDEDLEAIRKDYQEKLRKEKERKEAEERQKKEEAKKSQEEQEYAQYLKLKQKFEHKSEHFSIKR